MRKFAMCTLVILALGTLAFGQIGQQPIPDASCNGVYHCPVGTTIEGDYGIMCTIDGGSHTICVNGGAEFCTPSAGTVSPCGGHYVDSHGVRRTCQKVAYNCTQS